MSELWDDPNRQAVGLEPAGIREGGETPVNGGNPLDAMTKAQLLEYAAANGVTGVDDTMTKADIRAAIDAAGA